ncbi:N-6 DNA methylase, partial [bacterium]|nr:N-6 DNA methylase [bacterium]
STGMGGNFQPEQVAGFTGMGGRFGPEYTLCEEKRKELEIIDEDYTPNRKKTTKKKLIQKLDDYREWLLSLTILDPACGSGAFLNQALDFLIEEHHKVDTLKTQLLGGGLVFSDIEKDILEKNIYGVDLNEESVEIAKLSLWLRTAKKGRKLNTLSDHIKCGNSLIDVPDVAGDKAFNWQEEFPKIFKNGGFDVVIGNPPYVNIVNIEDTKIRKYYRDNFSTFKNKCDLYSLFIERSIGFIKPNGKLGFIFPNSWLGTSSFLKFRKALTINVCPEQLVELPNGVFIDAIVTTVIMIVSNKKPKNSHCIQLYYMDEKNIIPKNHTLTIQEILSTANYSYSFDPMIQLKGYHLKLGDIVKFSLGIKTSDDKRFIFNYKRNDKCYPMLRGKDIGRYRKKFNNTYIWYMPELIKEKVGGRPRVIEHFLKPKILIQDVAKIVICTYDDENYLVNDTINVIHEVKPPFNMFSLLGILNSTLCTCWFKSHFPEGLHIKINQLQEIPIPLIRSDESQNISDKVKNILRYNTKLEKIANQMIELLHFKLSIEKPSKKLYNWHEYNFRMFINELKKLKIELNLSEESEWMQFFNEQKQKTYELKMQIDQIYREIDHLVYRFYDLTEEEIKIVEESF